MKLLNGLLILSALLVTTSAFAGAGDSAKGKSAFESKGCVGCHGTAGKSTNPANPALNGKGGAFIKEQLMAFKSGTRKNPTMNAMAGMLSDEDVGNIATYLGAQK